MKTGKITPLVLALTLVGMLLLGFSNDLIGIDIGGFSEEDTPGVERILPTDQTEPGDSIPIFISPNDIDSYYAVKEDFGGLIFMHQHTADNYSEDAFIMIGPDQFFYILTSFYPYLLESLTAFTNKYSTLIHSLYINICTYIILPAMLR